MSDLIVVQRKHAYGWVPSLPGVSLPRADTGGLIVRDEVDPRRELPPLVDQLKLGSCTANATAAAFEYDAILDGADPGALSRLWIYYFERAIEGTLGQGDTGAMGHDAFKVARHGIPSEEQWPYDIARFEVRPPAEFPRAYTLKKQVHEPVQSEVAIKQVLSNRQTIAFGFTVYESFEQPWATQGVMPVPGPDEQPLGGHENEWVGYLAKFPGYLLCRNSWTAGRPAELDVTGYYLMPISVAVDQNQVSDLRTIVRPAGT